MTKPENSIDYSEHALDILETAMALIDTGQRCALVISIAIEGGAAREVGSLAAVAASGAMTGYLSNGCIDRDIVVQAVNALATGTVKHIRYGAGSPFMDLKLPCGGALELVIDPTPDADTLRRALAALRNRQVATLSVCPKMGVRAGANGPVRFRYAPKPALILAGRGAILGTTAKLAAQMDFELHIVTPDVADFENLADLAPKSMVRLITPDDAPKLPIDAFTALLLLFHDHEWEQQLLLTAAQAQPFFIGALGSMKTQRIRLLNLQAAGLSDEVCKLIRGPIGLVPSLRNASQIAVSALAEVVSEMPELQVQES
jgi:xanthine dehydrogenase accessory factor